MAFIPFGLVSLLDDRKTGCPLVREKSGKGGRALRGYFGPLESQKLKVAFHQFHLIGLLEE